MIWFELIELDEYWKGALKLVLCLVRSKKGDP